MKRRTIIIISAMLLLALATVGVGYGLWFEVLAIGGRVTTGEVDVELSLHPESIQRWVEDGQGNVVWIDRDGIPDFVGLDVGDARYIPEKDVSNCYADFVEPTSELIDANVGNTQDDGPNQIKIWVDNAYPSFHCWVGFDVTNIGTIPVHLTLPELEIPEVGPNPEDYVMVDERFCYTKAGDPLWGAPYQVHPGESVWCAVIVHFENDDYLCENAGNDGTNQFTQPLGSDSDNGVVEPWCDGTPYEFTFSLMAHQWNETPADIVIPD